MQASLDQLEVALRVLKALTEKRLPDAEDLRCLRTMADPQMQHLPPDELACAVIQAALSHRAKVRGAAKRP